MVILSKAKNLVIAKSMELKPKISFRDRITYFLKYDTSPEMADFARDRLVQELRIIQMFKTIRLIDNERLEQLRIDPEVQKMYARLLKSGRDGGKKAKEVEVELTSLPIDIQAGFFEFKRKYYEDKLHLKLISPEDEEGF